MLQPLPPTAPPPAPRATLVATLGDDARWIYLPELQGRRMTLGIGIREGQLAAVAQWQRDGSAMMSIGAGLSGVAPVLTIAYAMASRGLA
jgi:hypothetical protein